MDTHSRFRFFNLHNLQLAVLFCVLALALALGLANLLFGDLNQDEGWYLYAAQNVARGNLPYRDFFFTQGPVMPCVYAALAPLWSNFGVIGGRALTLLLGLVGASFAGLLAAKNFPRGQRLAPWVITFALTACSVYHSYFTTIPKTYALTSLFLILACLLLTRLQSRVAVFFAGLLFALATATRISMGAGAIAAGVWLLFQHRRAPWQWLVFATGGVIGLFGCFGFFWFTAWESWVFANLFHAGHEGGGLMFIGGSIARLVRGYFPLSVACVLATFLFFKYRIDSPRFASPRLDSNRNIYLWLSVALAIIALQLLSPFPYDDYHVLVMPLLAAAAATIICRNLDKFPFPAPAMLAFVTLVVTLNAVSSPNVQSWFFIRQDRFWPVMKSQPDILRLTHTAGKIPPNSLLLTQDAYLAVAGGHHVPQGFEMGPFGNFLSLSDYDAQRHHVLNLNLIKHAITNSAAQYAMFSGYAFAMEAPAMTPIPDAQRAEIFSLIAEHFELIETIENFGQGHTPLTIWKRK